MRGGGGGGEGETQVKHRLPQIYAPHMLRFDVLKKESKERIKHLAIGTKLGTPMA